MESVKKENNGYSKSKDNVAEFGKVVLTLKNCLLTEDKLSPTPSFLDGLDSETEADLRILGCELIQTAGILLRLPQVAMATAQVLFQRFFFSKSFVRQSCEVTGMGCLYLASKIEEAPRRIRDVINVYNHIKQVNSQKTLSPMILDQNYISLKYQVIKAERRVLKELGFCVHVKHPHKLIVLYLQVLGLETKQNLMQVAWNYMNDALRTDVFVRYQPETVACACIYLTARKLKIPLPRAPLWFAVFKVDEADIQDVALRILRLYTRNKPKAEELEKKVQELCKKFEETRLRNKAGFNNLTSGNNTPNSPAATDKKASPKRSHSDRSRSRSASDSPRHKRYKRSRSRSYDKYKKSRSRRSRSNSPASKTSHKDKRHRSRSRSYEREHKEGKYIADRYKEYYRDDRYRRDDDRYRRDDDRYRKEDDYKYKKDEDSKYKKDEDSKYKKEDDSKYKKEDDSKYKKEDDKYRRDEDAVRVRKDDVIKSRKDDDVVKSRKDEEKIRRDDEYRREDEIVKHRKDDDRRKKEEDGHKHKKEKISIKEDEGKKLKTKHASSKHKSSGEKKKKKKHYDEGFDDDDDEIEIIHVKKEKKSR